MQGSVSNLSALDRGVDPQLASSLYLVLLREAVLSSALLGMGSLFSFGRGGSVVYSALLAHGGALSSTRPW